MSAESTATIKPPGIRALCAYFLRLGTFGFGGPVALAGYMQRDLVEDRGWISPQDYRDGLAVAQVAPGPLAAQLAMWLAFVRHGVRGATLVSLAFVGPAFLMVVALAWVYVAAGGATWVGSVFYGVAPAAIAIISLSAWRLTALTLGADPLLIAIAAVLAGLTVLTGSEVAIAFIIAGFVVVAERGLLAGAIRGLAQRFRGRFLAVGFLDRRFLRRPSTCHCSGRCSGTSPSPARSSLDQAWRSCRSCIRASSSSTVG